MPGETESHLPSQRRWKKPLLVVFAGFLLILAGAFLIDGLGASRLDHAVREAHALGGPVTLSEILAARPTIPDDRNGAHAILDLQPFPAARSAGNAVPICGDADAVPLGRR